MSLIKALHQPRIRLQSLRLYAFIPYKPDKGLTSATNKATVTEAVFSQIRVLIAVFSQVRVLISYGATATAKNRAGTTALHAAADKSLGELRVCVCDV